MEGDAGGTRKKDDEARKARTWAMLCHLAGLALYVGVPVGNVIGPLVVWLVKKEESDLVDAQGKVALNFQISWTIYMAGAFVLCFVLVGIPILILLGIAHFILTIVGAVKVSNGDDWSYPLVIRFLA